MFFKKFSKKTFLSLFSIGLFCVPLIISIDSNNFCLKQSNDENVVMYDEFVDDVNSQLDLGAKEININYDVDLSGFDSSHKISYSGVDQITFDFEGHTIKNKSNEYDSTPGPSGSQTLIVNGDSSYWSYSNQSLFDSITNLTIENVTIENSTFIVYNSDSLTLNNVIYKDSFLENIYLKTAGSTEISRYLSLFGDTISNLTITNSAFYNVGVRQTVWNYSHGDNSSYIGLFTRVGDNASSNLTLENNYFGNIDFSNNQRGVQDNPDGDWNVGLFTSISGNVISHNNYYDEIFFAINNDSLETYKVSALFIFSHDQFESADIKDDKISAFVNSYKASKNEFFYAANEAYYNGSTNNPGEDVVLDSNFNISNTVLINFTEAEANEYVKTNFGTAPLGLVSINDFNSVSSFQTVTLNQFKSETFLNENFSSDFYLLNEGELPTPILSIIFLEIQNQNEWTKINVAYELKNGFMHLNSDSLVTINFYQRGKSEVISSYDLKFNDLNQIIFQKPDKNKEYYYDVVYQNQSIYGSDYFAKMQMPVWVSLLISIIVIVIFLILLLIFLLFLRRKQKEAAQLQDESENISLAIYESSNLFGFSFEEALYLLDLQSKDLSTKTLDITSKKLTKSYEKQGISYDEYLKKYEAIIYLKAHLGEVK